MDAYEKYDDVNQFYTFIKLYYILFKNINYLILNSALVIGNLECNIQTRLQLECNIQTRLQLECNIQTRVSIR